MRLPEGHPPSRPPEPPAQATAAQPMAHKLAAGDTAQRLSDLWSVWSATVLLG